MGTLYRIENAHGKGPYGGSSLMNEWANKKGINLDNSKHPRPSDDSLLCAETGFCPSNGWDEYSFFNQFHYGFKDVETLRRWFYDDQLIKDLEEEGFVLAVYQGEVYHGHTQSVVKSDSRKKITESPLLSIL